MKKLMFLAAVAAATVASANVCVTQKVKDECGEVELVTGAGTAHKVAISLKTTGIAKTTKKAQCEDAVCTYYRVQKTVKINGLIWEQLDDCTGCTLLGANSTFWTKTDAVDAELTLALGVYGKGTDSKKIEAYGELAGDEFGYLTWAGFGKLTEKTTKATECTEADCSAWVKSISGGIAGVLVAPEYDDSCVDCDPIDYANCCDDLQMLEDVTAAYGTIKITYDASTAKKVAVAADGDDPTSFYKIPAAVANDIVVNEVTIEE